MRHGAIAESKAVLSRRIVNTLRRLCATKNLHDKLDLLASQNADIAALISAKHEFD
jgi:hypothetical protein